MQLEVLGWVEKRNYLESGVQMNGILSDLLLWVSERLPCFGTLASDAALLASWDAVVVKGVWKTDRVASHRVCLFCCFPPNPPLSPSNHFTFGCFWWTILKVSIQVLFCLVWQEQYVAYSTLVVLIKECNFLPPPLKENKTSFETIPRGTISYQVESTWIGSSAPSEERHTHTQRV